MTHSVRTRRGENATGLDPTVYVLEDGAGGVAEVWPALGFNCFRWSAARGGQALDLIYSDPALFQGASPTRSGVPVLFPFPNRIRDGRFAFSGKEYQLPLNDSAKKNAIHGFACRVPWRAVNHGADGTSAWVTGEFRCSVDAPQSLALWPADQQIRLTVRLGRGTLRLEAVVTNPDTKPLPWGLGYHPYFRATDDSTVEVPAREFWVLEGNLPTGERRPVDRPRDLKRPRRVGELSLDDVLTGLPARPPRMDGLLERAAITAAAGGPLRLFCSEGFRHLVVFTPPHRHAFCVEPYTCTTDAANRTDGGWEVLAPGASVELVVELWV
jgi:aldose 1-epimerase